MIPDLRRAPNAMAKWLPIMVVGLVASLIGLSIESSRLSRNASALVRRSHQAQLALERLFIALLDAETGQRGFLLTSDPSYLAPYERSAPQVAASIRALRAQLVDDEQRRRLDEIEALSRAKLDELARTIALRRNAGAEEAVALIRTNEGKRAMDAIRAQITAMEARIDSRRDERVRALQKWERVTYGLVLCSDLALVAALVAGWTLRRIAGERSRLDAQRDAMFDELPVGVILVGAPDGRTLYSNRKASDLLGYDGAVPSMPTAGADAAPASKSKLDALPLSRALGGATISGEEVVLRRRDGADVVALASAAPFRDQSGAVRFALAAFYDISEKKRAEQELARVNRDLERRVLERTQRLGELNKELEAFGYSVSHDLRTPLRAISGYTQILAEKYSNRLDEQGRTTLSRVRDAAQLMGRLIDDMLALSGITRAEIQRERVDVSAMAKSLLQDLRDRDPTRTVEVSVERGVEVIGDRRLLRAALANLFDNAWKFTSKRPVARIAFGVERREGETVYFVSDDGAGFDMEHAARLFSPFQRLHTSAEFEGTGIGLAIVQRVIAKHGGRVWVEAASDRGAKFSFTLGGAS